MVLMIENAVGRGLEVLGLGMLVVVGMLMLLMVCLYLIIPILGKINSKGTTKSKKKGKKEETTVVVDSTPVAETEPTTNDAEIVTAITAAISVYENKSPSTFKVVSFKRI
ncbi:MAG: OadG family protein [Clostridia bacterium]|nr:OadG family protein [Clostridia bacterium]